MPCDSRCETGAGDLICKPLQQKETVLAYTNVTLLWRITTKLNLEEDNAKVLLTALLQFLYLAAKYAKPLSPSKMIDQAWHLFIEDTKAYREFCSTILGRFIDHVPSGPDDNKATFEVQLKKTIELARQEFGELSAFWEDTSEQTLQLSKDSLKGPAGGDGNCESCSSDCRNA